MRTIKVYGDLAKFLGQNVFEAEVNTVGEVVRFLCCNFRKLEAYMADKFYKVLIGKQTFYDLELVNLPLEDGTIRIIPVVGGNFGSGGIFEIIAGIALVAVSFFLPPILAFAAPAIFGIGASLALGGVAQLLTPVPPMPSANFSRGEVPKFSPLDTPQFSKSPVIDSSGSSSSSGGDESFAFSNIVNTSRQGLPIPVVYGKMPVGSIVVSSGIVIGSDTLINLESQ